MAILFLLQVTCWALWVIIGNLKLKKHYMLEANYFPLGNFQGLRLFISAETPSVQL